MTKSKNKLDYILLVLLILSFPINLKIISFLRLIDILALGGFLYVFFRDGIAIDRQFIKIIFFIIALVISSFVGINSVGEINRSGIFFTLKYIFIFAIFFQINKFRLSSVQIKNCCTLYNLCFLFLVIYVLFYFFVANYFGFNLPKRPSFPFTSIDENYNGDAHLFSAYLSLSSIFYFYCIQKKILKLPSFISGSFLVLSWTSIVLTGSRTGIFILCIGFLALFVMEISIKKIIKIIPYLIIFFIVMYLSAGYWLDYFNDKIYLLERSMNFDLISDNSSIGRINKGKQGFQEYFAGPLVFGIGMQSTQLIWYDSSIVTILLSSGLFGFVLFCSVIYEWFFSIKKRVFTNSGKKTRNYFCVVFFCFVIANLISEYFLVSRGLVPFAIICFFISIEQKLAENSTNK